MTEPWLYALLGALLALIAVGALKIFVIALGVWLDARATIALADDIDWEQEH